MNDEADVCEPSELKPASWRTRATLPIRLGAFLASDPRSLRDLMRWVRDCFASPLRRRIPWWPYPVQRFVAKHLPPNASVFEFGGGGSTLWLEDHGGHVTTVEHDEQWYGALIAAVGKPTAIRRVPATAHGTVSSAREPGFFDDYIATIIEVDSDSLDLVVVDGRARVACALNALTKIRPGGLLLLDDSNRSRYRAVHDRLASWPSYRFCGLKPGGLIGAESTVWIRPAIN